MDWVAQHMECDLERDEVPIAENPRSSSIFSKSPLKKVTESPSFILGDNKRYHTDQCQFGAIDETGLPTQKATALLATGIQLRHSVRQCKGENKCKDHGILQGRVGSIHRTALSAVYPWLFCLALLMDVATHIGNDTVQHNIGSNVQRFGRSQSHFVGWTCERCKHGAKKVGPDGQQVDTPPHTKVKGCRFDPLRAGGSSSVPPGGVPAPAAAGPAAAAAHPAPPAGPVLAEPPAPAPEPDGAGDAQPVLPKKADDDEEADEASVPQNVRGSPPQRASPEHGGEYCPDAGTADPPPAHPESRPPKKAL